MAKKNKKVILSAALACALLLGLAFTAPAAHTAATPDAGALNVEHYDITLEVYPEEEWVKGTTALLIEKADSKSAYETHAEMLYLKLATSLNAIRVATSYGMKLAFLRSHEDLVIFLPNDLTAEAGNFSIKIDYAGRLESKKDGRSWSYIGKDSAYAVYESYWYPQKPGDRASGKIKIITPDDWTAVSNGDLISTAESFVWEDTFPEVGFSFAASKYKETLTLDGHMGVKCYLTSYVQNCDELLKDILFFMETKLSRYPYQKLALVEVIDSLNGGHGDQSLVIISSDIVRNDGKFLEFLAHEVAHNWFGDLVTAEEFTKRKNLWLLEGTASYFSTLYLESNDKELAEKSLENMRREYLYARKNGGDAAISEADEDRGSIFHAVVYSKGAWVLHMLRYVVGDENFYRIFREYFARYTWGDASIDDFESLTEEVSGQDLTWFFDQWLHKALLPNFAISGAEVRKLDSGYSLKLNIEQEGDLVEMPVNLYIKTRNASITKRVNVKNREEKFSFMLEEKPVFAEIDREKFILEEKKTDNRKILNYGLSRAHVSSLIYMLKGYINENLMIY